MRRILLLAFLCLLAVSFTGCKKARLRAQVRELMKSTITLPKDISCVFNGKVYPMPDSLRKGTKLIIFVDSTECSKCRISRFIQYEPFFKESLKTGRFDVLLLLSIKENETEELVSFLSLIESPFPIYIDDKHCFMQLNPILSSDSRFQGLLIDREGHPLLIGDPASSDKIREMFFSQINTLPL